jgi:hypothetical protein
MIGMALGKMFEKDVIERRFENGAAIIFEYQHPHASSLRITRPQTLGTSSHKSFELSHEQKKRLRAFFEKAKREADEQLAREKTFVFRLSKDRTLFWTLGYMTKREACDNTLGGMGGGVLRELDGLYRGVLIFCDHLYISETTFARALERYGEEIAPAFLIDHLCRERLAAMNA